MMYVYSAVTDIMQSEVSSGYIMVIQPVISKKLEKELWCKHLRINARGILKCAIHHCTFATRLQQATAAIYNQHDLTTLP